MAKSEYWQVMWALAFQPRYQENCQCWCVWTVEAEEHDSVEDHEHGSEGDVGRWKLARPIPKPTEECWALNEFLTSYFIQLKMICQECQIKFIELFHHWIFKQCKHLNPVIFCLSLKCKFFLYISICKNLRTGWKKENGGIANTVVNVQNQILEIVEANTSQSMSEVHLNLTWTVFAFLDRIKEIRKGWRNGMLRHSFGGAVFFFLCSTLLLLPWSKVSPWTFPAYNWLKKGCSAYKSGQMDKNHSKCCLKLQMW